MARHQDYFNKIFKEKSRKQIYFSMDDEDIAEVVLAAVNIIKSCPLDPPPMKYDQTQTLAQAKFYKEKNDNRNALIAFNKAICRSQKNSKQQLRACLARTFFLCKIRDIEGCLMGVEICKTMNMNHVFENVIEDIVTNCAISLHLRPRIEKQPNVLERNFFVFIDWLFVTAQCAIAQVHLSVELGVPVIKAKRAIGVGTLVALEKPFVSLVDNNQRYTACHHCHLISNNLIPCDDCCYVMYCGEKCKQIATKQYHEIECKVSDLLEDLTFDTTERLMVKAVIKMKLLATWWEFIQHSERLCGNQNDHLLPTEVNEIFDRNNKFSLLKCRPERLIIQGKVYNASFKVAAIIKRLARVKFFPSDDRKELAIRAFARIMLYLVVFPPRTITIPNCADKSKPLSEGSQNVGWFCFTSRLQHNCDPNLLQMGIGNKIALISLRDIPKGSDLTISFLGHFYDNPMQPEVRASKLLRHLEIWCHCRVCSEILDCSTKNVSVLTSQEKACYEEWKKTIDGSTVLQKTNEGVTVLNFGAAFIACRKAMAGLQYATGSRQHREVFRFFSYLLKKSQREAIRNFTIEDDNEDTIEHLSF